MEEMRIIKHTMDNLYSLLGHNRDFTNWTKVDPDDDYAKRSDEKRRFYAWILLAHLVNDLHHMGMFSEDDRLRIIDLLDDIIVRNTKSKN